MNPFSNKWVVVGIAVTVAIQLIIVYALAHIGINPFSTEAFPAQWWVLIVLLGHSGFLLVELEEFVVERINRVVNKEQEMGLL